MLFISDNGNTFKAKEVKQFLLKREVQWRYNLPKSSWWGGFFERMVCSTKQCLEKVLSSSRLTYKEMLMILVEVEGVLHSHPLTYVYSDDTNEPMTPLHLLLYRKLLSKPEVSEDINIANDAEELTGRATYLRTLLQRFWQR